MNQQTLFDKTPLVYSTDHFTEEQKAATKANANKQEARILEFFRDYVPAWGSIGVSTIWAAISSTNEPITSFRRALTNLAKQGKVEKTDEVRMGMYGRNEHLWRLKRDDA